MDLRATSIETYQANIRPFETVIGAEREIESITLDDVIRFKHVTTARVAPVTYNSYLNMVQILFRFGVRQGYVAKDHPVFELKFAKLQKRPARIVQDEAIAKALDFLSRDGTHIRPHWFWHAAVMVLAHTGMRRRQLAEMEWRDVDFVSWVLRYRVESSKSRKAWEIPIPPQIQPVFCDIAQRSMEATGLAMLDPTSRVFNLQLFSVKPCVAPVKVKDMLKKSPTLYTPGGVGAL